MKTIFNKSILFGAIALATMGSFATSYAASPKRGVSENAFSMGGQLDALEPGSCWYYNWGNTPKRGYEDKLINNEHFEFVPMCWNANYDADAIREYCRTHPNTKYLLGFNEPNFTAQANMTPQKAAEEWPKVQALAAELGLKLVAPALNYSPNPPYTNPLTWMDEFVALVGLDAFDYTAIHNYGGLGVMKTLAGNFHDRYGKDVWVTEFCFWPNEGDPNSYVAPETQIQSMTETVKWLEQTPWIFRYAWFKALGNYESSKGPNFGLVRIDGSGLDADWVLTPQGQVYTYLGDFDENTWHPTDTPIAATEFVDFNGLNVFPSASPEAGTDIEISRFNAAANATWQFDVVEAGDYDIIMRISGFGEPTRFDPTLQWYTVIDGEETELTTQFAPQLPNSDEVYIDYKQSVQLPAGHIGLKLYDKAPYRPSGIKISKITLKSTAGINEISISDEEEIVDVYTASGVKVASKVKRENALGNLPSGLYIVGGRKVLKNI